MLLPLLPLLSLAHGRLRVFFSQLFSGPALGYGLLLGLAAVGTKLVTGRWAAKRDAWPVGWAMVGRGELGFVMVSGRGGAREIEKLHCD